MIPIALIVTGCAAFQPSGAEHNRFVSADVLRWRDEGGVVRNDLCTVTDAGQIATLQGFFPEMLTQKVSSLQSDYWYPLIIVRFHAADGSVKYVESDYRIYHVDDGRRGLFVASDGFIDFADGLPYHPAPPRPAPPGPVAPPPQQQEESQPQMITAPPPPPPVVTTTPRR
ncbi:MAG TPA: hypothetical protein VL992_04790 [Tepidisphaeraceae bacterium]|nr:hypothetical protein [Tepidisphaeraceae bacterium]